MAGTVVAAPASGQRWERRPSGTTAELRGLSVVNERVAWASGAGGHVARTTDGGATWRVDTIAGATGLDLRGVHAWSENVAWAMSAGPAEEGQARIYHTRDGGVTWTLQYSTREKGVFLDAIAFWDAHHGIAMSDPVGGRLFLLVTDDGGKHWKRVPPEGLPPMMAGEAAFAASGSCLVVEGASRAWIGTGGAATARVFRTTDRGRHWKVAETRMRAGGPSTGIFSLAFRDARHGVAVGGDYRKARDPGENVGLTRDGGRSWTLPRGQYPLGYMSSVAYRLAGARPTLVAVGLGGTALSTDDGQSWRMVDSVAYNSVRFAGRTGIAVGPGGKVALWREAVSGR